MSKRNLILLIVVLGIIVIAVLGFFYFYQPKNQTGRNTEGTNFFANFLPFGKNNKTTTPGNETAPQDISGYVSPEEEGRQSLTLRKVSSFPVAGFGVFMKERFKDAPTVTAEEQKGETGQPTASVTEFVPALRYVNKATGNIYQTFADIIDERKFSQTMIPVVHEAYFGNSGESVVMRYLREDFPARTGDKTIQTFVGGLPKEYPGAEGPGTNELTGSFLPENISDMSVSPDNSSIFYLFNIGDNAIGVIFSFQTKAKVQIFDSPFTEWLSFWPNDKMITVTTKPSSGVPGYMYAMERKSAGAGWNFNKILGGINGLTTLASPDGKIILYGDSNLSLFAFNRNTGNSNLLGVKTLPEKCVWGTSSDVVYCAVPKFIDQARYPDSWYQGEVSFADEIWKINPQSGNTTILLDPISSKDGENIDGIKLNLDENQNYLFFVNKKDSYLWKFNLK